MNKLNKNKNKTKRGQRSVQNTRIFYSSDNVINRKHCQPLQKCTYYFDHPGGDHSFSQINSKTEKKTIVISNAPNLVNSNIPKLIKHTGTRLYGV